MEKITILPNGTITKEPITNTFMTCLQTEIEISYQKIVDTFGEPNASHDNYKVDAEWAIETPEGVATIYNYKTGKNYLGDEGQAVEDITDWHIGGHDKKSSEWIIQLLTNKTRKE